MMHARKKQSDKVQRPVLVHPGVILREEFLKPMGLNGHQLALRSGISKQHIGQILAGRSGIGPKTAVKLAKFFGTTAQLWMDLHAHYKLDRYEDSHVSDRTT